MPKADKMYKRNTILTNELQKHKILKCDCVKSKTEPHCFDERCSNFDNQQECSWRCGKMCQNRRLKKRGAYRPSIERHTAAEAQKGQGVFAKEDIPAGTLISEFVGELINKSDRPKREARYRQEKLAHDYMVEFAGVILDPTKKGNIAKFANHSCDPNAICEAWKVPGKTCNDALAIIAIKKIPAGEEITFDYGFRSNLTPQVCLCGSDNCKGFIGKPM